MRVSTSFIDSEKSFQICRGIFFVSLLIELYG